jgi:hypothetical protein
VPDFVVARTNQEIPTFEAHDRMAEGLRLRNFSPATWRIYLLNARAFARSYRKSPEELGESEIRAFLLHQIEVKRLAHDSYRQIYAALKFLYTVTLGRPWDVVRIPHPRVRVRRLPVERSREDWGPSRCSPRRADKF